MPGGYDLGAPPDEEQPEKAAKPPEKPEKPEKEVDPLKAARKQDPLKGVGCECCHGGSRRHLGIALKDRFATAKSPFLRTTSARRNCRRCHNADRPCLEAGASEPFEPSGYFQDIKHWE